jgi:hypothetical protein
VIDNHTFNGRNGNQYLLDEDYDGDGRDDTPADVHYDAGLGCIDCHGSWDLHGGDVADMTIRTRMEHGVAIACENCHGTISAYATTTGGSLYDGTPAQVAVDSKGNAQQHVWTDTQGYYWLKSRLTGDVHFLPQTKDTVTTTVARTSSPGSDLQRQGVLRHGPRGRDSHNGTGPLQTDGSATAGFAHGDTMSCVACHAAWENNCIGCHLEGEYNTNPNNNSNITGERIVYRQRNADFVYQNPTLFQLGVNAHDKIAPISPNTEAFYTWWDQQGDESQTFTFSDRNGMGSSTAVTQHPSMSHNLIMPHSIRGEVSAADEGPALLQRVPPDRERPGQLGHGVRHVPDGHRQRQLRGAGLEPALPAHRANTNNDLDSPFFVHMASGLGTGLFLFDVKGCPVNPVDDNDARIGATASRRRTSSTSPTWSRASTASCSRTAGDGLEQPLADRPLGRRLHPARRGGQPDADRPARRRAAAAPDGPDPGPRARLLARLRRAAPGRRGGLHRAVARASVALDPDRHRPGVGAGRIELVDRLPAVALVVGERPGRGAVRDRALGPGGRQLGLDDREQLLAPEGGAERPALGPAVHRAAVLDRRPPRQAALRERNPSPTIAM